MKITHQAMMILVDLQKQHILRYIKRIDALNLNHTEVIVTVLVHDDNGSLFIPGLLPREYEMHAIANVQVTVGLVSRPRARAVLLEGGYKGEAELLGQDNVHAFVVGFGAFAALGIPESN